MTARETEIEEVAAWLSARELDVSSESQASLRWRAILGARKIALETADLAGKDSPRSLARWVVENADRLYDPLVRLSPPTRDESTEGRRLLICVHALSGHARVYRQLAHLLGPDATVWGLQARGLNPGETTFQSCQEMLGCYFDAVSSLSGSLSGQRPIQVLGFSSGGLWAHALSVALANAGFSVAPPLVLDTMLYQALPQMPSMDEFLTIMFSGAQRSLTEEALAQFQARSLTERIATFFEGPDEAGSGRPSTGGMPESAILRIGKVGYDQHRLMRSFQPASFPGTSHVFRSLDSAGWGKAFVLWEPPTRELVIERLACLHIRLLSKDSALQKIADVVRSAEARRFK